MACGVAAWIAARAVIGDLATRRATDLAALAFTAIVLLAIGVAAALRPGARRRPPGTAMALVALAGIFAVVAGAIVAGCARLAHPLVAGRGRRVWPAALVAMPAATALLLGASAALPSRRAAILPWAAALLGALLPIAARRASAAAASRPLAVIAAGGAASLGALALAAPIVHAALREVDLARPALLLAAALAARVAAGALGTRRDAALAIGAALLVALVPASRVIARRQDLRGVLLRDAPIAGVTLRLLRAAGDVDRDGYSAWFGGGDCAPFDARRHPFARERASDGVDDDCSGADLPRASRERAPATAPVSDLALARPDLVLVTIETLRATAVGAYEPDLGRDATPAFDAFAASGTLFERAYCTSPVTHRALPSLLTALLPSEMPESLRGAATIGSRRLTLPEALAARGYESRAVMSKTLLERHGLAQGWSEISGDTSRGFHPRFDRERTNRALAIARAWSPAPQLLWVHFHEPHGPHEAPPDEPARGPGEREAYAAEIRKVDRELGRFLGALRATERGARAIVAVTADHGEELYEHGRHYHAQALYEESVRVPLAVAGPGVASTRVATPVDHLDLAATLATLGGAPRLGHGRDLRPALRGDAAAVEPRPVALELYPMRSHRLGAVALVERRRKVIADVREALFELYDLEVDPGERVNRWDDESHLSADLRNALLRHVERARAAAPR